MRKTILCTLGILFAVVGVISAYTWAYIATFHFHEWWTIPTIMILIFLGVCGSIFGTVFSFKNAFGPDKLK